ncbi:DUF2184 domain-containing protein [Euryhalocaulis caribicus]|uniref:DUF2184 domain-containing protein n=1 Tax=Euryhalocaulis caribicus TaxID=1161401 RepID=UPI00039F374E|nr:DUF2184 domain-containing protein [Euryhalocaulis caribicus]
MPMELIDAQSALGFLTRQAAHIEPTVYQKKYPSFDYTQLIDVDTSAGDWAQSIEFYSSDKLGQAEWFNHLADDVPRADAQYQKHTHAVEMAAIGYGYSLQEIGYAQRLGINLTTDRADAARMAYEKFVYDVAIRGDSAKGWTGLTNDASVNAANVAADGSASSRLWTDKTPVQILRDVNEALTAVYEGSLQVEMANTVLLPISAYTYIATQPMSSDYPNKTILQFIKETNIYTAETGQPLTVRGLRGLEDDGATNTGRMIVYRKDPQVVKLHLPVPLRFLPVWQTGPMKFEVPGYFRLGGVEIRLPGAVRYRDGITA